MRIALAGLGGIAQGCHLPAYAKAGFDVVGGADPKPECRDAVTHIPTFESVEDMLGAVEPEVVDVTIHPGPAKNEVIRMCLDAGCHVLAQKPFTKDLADAVALVEHARQADRLLAVNVQARFAPAFLGARQAIEQGRIGTPLSAFIASTFPLGGNTVIDMGIHEVDLLRFWLGADPQRARATVAPLRGDRSNVVIEVDFGDAYGTVLEENHAPAMLPWSFRIHGTDGTIEGREQFGTVEPAELRVDNEPVELTYPYVPDAFALVMASLIDAAHAKTEAPTSAADHLKSLAAVLAADKAVATGVFEKVELSC